MPACLQDAAELVQEWAGRKQHMFAKLMEFALSKSNSDK
jgi:hypothetical protein